jgi:hypothetical protein
MNWNISVCKHIIIIIITSSSNSLSTILFFHHQIKTTALLKAIWQMLISNNFRCLVNIVRHSIPFQEKKRKETKQHSSLSNFIMKLSVLTTLAAVTLSTHNCNAFSTSRRTPQTPVIALNAANSDNADSDDAGLVTRRAAAKAMLLSASAALVASPMVAQADTSLDFALPSYDTKMSGFGDGNEAYVKKGTIVRDSIENKMMTDPGADEKEKERAAMAKAEEARKEALTRKKAEQKDRDDETKRRAKEKKARDAERLKNIWSS